MAEVFVRMINQRTGETLGRSILLADSFLLRLRGYLFRSPPKSGEGILLMPCTSVHGVGLRFPLDVAALSAEGRVLRIGQLRRSSLFQGGPSCNMIVEMASESFSADRLRVNDQIEIRSD